MSKAAKPTIAARDKIMVSPAEAAALCSVSLTTFYSWAMPAVRTGTIRSMRVGRNVRIFTDSLLAWLEQQRAQQEQAG